MGAHFEALDNGLLTTCLKSFQKISGIQSLIPALCRRLRSDSTQNDELNLSSLSSPSIEMAVVG